MAFLNVYFPKTYLIKALYSLDSSRQNGVLSQNAKTAGFRELFFSENDLKTCSRVNSRKWPKNKFMVFRALFLFEVHIQQRWYLTGGNSSWSFIRRKKTEHFKILKKSIMAAQKCKNILMQAALRDFWSSANPKLKRVSLPKLSLLARMGVLGSYLCLQVI